MDFKELVVWQKSMQLVKLCYQLTEKLPQSEVFGLSSQVRRASVSIPANIAEGRKRRSRGDFVQFLRMATGSAAELETLLLLMIELYPKSKVESESCLDLSLEVQKMLNKMISSLEAKS